MIPLKVNVSYFNFFSGRRVASSNQITIVIILSCLLGVVSVLAILGFMLFCHARKRDSLPAKPEEPPVKKV